jgi:hypothetical protein
MLWDNIATFRFTVSAPSNYELDDQLYDWAREYVGYGVLEEEVQPVVTRLLGPEFEVRVSLEPGSLEVLLGILVTGGGVVGVKR